MEPQVCIITITLIAVAIITLLTTVITSIG